MPELKQNNNKKSYIHHVSFSPHSFILQKEFKYLTDTMYLIISSQAVSNSFINLKQKSVNNQFLKRNSEISHMKDIVIESSIPF